MNLRTNKLSHLFLPLAAALVLLVAGPAIATEPRQFAFTYQVIREFGPIETLQKKVGPNEVLKASEDGKNAYILRKAVITSEDELFRAMGANGESSLSDHQKGLVAIFRFSQSQSIGKFQQYQPPELKTIEVNLIDTNGFNDDSRYPMTKEDFWPSNARTFSYGAQPSIRCVIQVSGVDSEGYGSETAAEMKAMFSHEYGHSLDRTRTEANPYGKDGHHYWNEVIGERAAFSEGFANFIEISLFEKKRQQMQDSLEWVRFENAKGENVTQNPLSEYVKGTDFLKIEATNAFILYRLSKEIGGGFAKVFEAFTKSNNPQNTMANYLKTLVELYPADSEALARILDEATHSKLSDEEFRQILGRASGVEAFLARRSGRTPVKVAGTDPTPAVPLTPSVQSGKKRFYKWTDAGGSVHFSDQPPPAGVKYELRAPVTPKVESQGSNPFSDD